MATDNSAKIAVLETVLNSGARTVTVDGVSTTYRSASEILDAIKRLRTEDDTNDYVKRRGVKNINLGGF